MRLAILLFFLTTCVRAQTNLGPTNSTVVLSNSPTATYQSTITEIHLEEQVRNQCINGRRSICGRIIKMLPDALIIESGYTNLVRHPLDQSWLVPGTATANRPVGLIESNEPGSPCVGLVCLTEFPKSKRLKPKLYDYIIIEGYPAGQYTYVSVGNIHRTVRRFSGSISTSVNFNLAVAKTNQLSKVSPQP